MSLGVGKGWSVGGPDSVLRHAGIQSANKQFVKYLFRISLLCIRRLLWRRVEWTPIASYRVDQHFWHILLSNMYKFLAICLAKQRDLSVVRWPDQTLHSKPCNRAIDVFARDKPFPDTRGNHSMTINHTQTHAIMWTLHMRLELKFNLTIPFWVKYYWYNILNYANSTLRKVGW